MALTVRHLNADTTFLLTFTPAIAPRHAGARFPGSFTVLVDPWLSGPSSIWRHSFQVSHHTTESCIKSLTEIPVPDLIIVSQDKPDHCHRETLCSLPANTCVKILATPAAAKKIRSWNHFKNANIASFEPYNPQKDATILRVPIPGYTSFSPPGEVTVAYLPAKMDVTKLHNAIGITYRAPSCQTTAPSGTLVNLFNLPISPPASPDAPRPRARRTLSRTRSLSRSRSISTLDPRRPITPPDSPMDGQVDTTPLAPEREKAISVLYSPHGVASSAVAPYAATHLAKESALPLTALFHSINVEENPWFMGGVVAAGYPGGAELVRKFGARCWISAHDEAKDNRGWSVAFIKSTRYALEDAQKKIDDETATHERVGGKSYKKGLRRTKVVSLEPGKLIRIPDDL